MVATREITNESQRPGDAAHSFQAASLGASDKFRDEYAKITDKSSASLAFLSGYDHAVGSNSSLTAMKDTQPPKELVMSPIQHVIGGQPDEAARKAADEKVLDPVLNA